MHCLDDRQLGEYLSGKLPADTLIEACEHIRTCARCRARLAEAADYRTATIGLGAVATTTEDCPEYEVLSDLVDEKLVGRVLRSVERHVTNCELCWQDVETLQSARSRASLAPEITVVPGARSGRRTWRVFSWKSATATAVGAAAVAAVMMMSHAPVAKGPGSSQTIASNTPKVKIESPVGVKPNSSVVVPPKREVATNPPVTPEAPKTITPAPTRIAMLKDGAISVESVGGKIEVKSAGHDLESVVAASVNRKIRTGRLPADMKLAMNPETLRGSAGNVDIRKTSPAASGMLSSQPQFKWDAVDGAESYRIQVSSADGTTAVDTVTSATSFRTEKKLPAGAYVWTVSVRMGELAEWQASKAQSFRILSQSDAELLSIAKRKYAGSHLVMGTVYERLGMIDEATREYQALVKENPGSPLAEKLLSGVRSH